MSEKLNPITTRTFWVEAFGVIFNLLFTFLYLRSNPWCFVFGVLGPLAFIFLCFKKKLYAESVLQVFYIGLAIYGFIHWGGTWRMEYRSMSWHLPYLITGGVVTLAIAYILSKKTDGKLPLLDSFTAVFAIIGTWVMMNYVHENWLYFIAVNAVSLIIYPLRGMWMATIMFAIYLLMAIDGYFVEINIFAP